MWLQQISEMFGQKLGDVILKHNSPAVGAVSRITLSFENVDQPAASACGGAFERHTLKKTRWSSLTILSPPATSTSFTMPSGPGAFALLDFKSKALSWVCEGVQPGAEVRAKCPREISSKATGLPASVEEKCLCHRAATSSGDLASVPFSKKKPAQRLWAKLLETLDCPVETLRVRVLSSIIGNRSHAGEVGSLVIPNANLDLL